MTDPREFLQTLAPLPELRQPHIHIPVAASEWRRQMGDVLTEFGGPSRYI